MEGTFLLFSTPPSYPPAFASFSRIACARYLALSRPKMAAGLVAEPRRCDVVSAGVASVSAKPGRARPWADALPGRLPLPCARAAQAKCGRGPADSSGLAQ